MDSTIYYEIGTAIIIGIMLIAKSQFLKSDSLNQNFKHSAHMMIVCCIANSVLAMGAMDILSLSDRWMTIVKSFYGIALAAFLILQFRTLCLRIGFRSGVVRLYNMLLGVGFLALGILNMMGEQFFFYQNGILVRKETCFVFYLVYGIYYVQTLIVGIASYRKLRKSVFFSTIMVVAYPLSCFCTQLMLQGSQLIDVGSGMAILLYGFTLGDYDYDALQETKKRLVESREAQQESRQAVESAYGVKKRFMKKVSTDFMEPIDEVRSIGKDLLEQAKDPKIRESAEQIVEADIQLRAVVDSLVQAAEGDQ